MQSTRQLTVEVTQAAYITILTSQDSQQQTSPDQSRPCFVLLDDILGPPGDRGRGRAGTDTSENTDAHLNPHGLLPTIIEQIDDFTIGVHLSFPPEAPGSTLREMPPSPKLKPEVDVNRRRHPTDNPKAFCYAGVLKHRL